MYVPVIRTLAAHWEVHVSFDGNADDVRLQRTAEMLGAKVLVIELLGGAPNLALQPMVTFRATPDEVDATSQFQRMRAHVESAATTHGLSVARIKIETQPTDDVQAQYYESHVRVRGTADDFSRFLVDADPVMQHFDARVSRNGRRTDTVRCERFLTRRDYGSWTVAHPRHLAWLAAIDSVLKKHTNMHIAKVHEEAVLWDSRESMDAGWL